MIKIVELGAVVPDTGEPRVKLLNPELVKTASNEIQDFWATLSPNQEKAYIHVIAMSAWEYYGPNNNGDSFWEKDLREYHPSFIADGNIFLHHVNKDPRKSAGKPIYSFYNEAMHRIELVLAAEKKSPNAVEVMRRLNSGEQIYVSMGVNVKYDICSICNNHAKTRADYCFHLRYNMKKVLDDGRQVHAFNPAPLKFFDISLVSRPADRTAWALRKIASTGSADETYQPTSAELGEQVEDRREKIAAISKLSDIIKQVDGEVADIKDTDTPDRYELLRKIKSGQTRIHVIPSVDSETLCDKSISPGGMLSSIILSGAMPTLTEAAHISGRHHIGDEFDPETHIPQIIKALPRLLSMMRNNPDSMNKHIADIFGSYGGELSSGTPKMVITRVAPVVKKRIIVISNLEPQEVLSKQASDVDDLLNTYVAKNQQVLDTDSITRYMLTHMQRSPLGEGPARMDRYHVAGTDGKVYETSRYEAERANNPKYNKLLMTRLLGAALGAASIGAAAIEPSIALRTLASPALAIAAYKLLTKKIDGPKKVKSMEGHEIPVTTAFAAATRNMQKTAGTLWPMSEIAVGLEYSCF